MEPVIRAVTDWPAPLVQPSTRIRFGSAIGRRARFLSRASWSRAPGPGVAPLPVTTLTLPCHDAFMSLDGALSARSMDGTRSAGPAGTAVGAGAGAAACDDMGASCS